MKKLIVNALLSGLLVTAAGATPVLADDRAETDTQVEQETPSLIPGHLFYFIKTVVENIQLVLTFDDTDKALLLAEHAQERILEANVLIVEGYTDLAAETLQKALNNQQLALEQANHTEALTSSETSFDSFWTGAVAVNEDADESQAIEEGEDIDAHEDIEGAEDEDSEVKQQFSGLLKQNIVSLILAMDKVENQRAKAALAKNIEKSFGKLATKSAKFAATKEVEVAVQTDAPLKQLTADVDAVQSERAVDAQYESAAVITSTEQTAAALVVAKIEEENKLTNHAEKVKVKAEKQAKKEKGKFKVKMKAQAKAKVKAEKQHGKHEKSDQHHKGHQNKK